MSAGLQFASSRRRAAVGRDVDRGPASTIPAEHRPTVRGSV